MAERFDPTWLSRVEDASLNASAPPQQRWIDGWLVRFSPGKARRARCINAVAPGRLPVAEKLRLAAEVYAEAGLPMHARLTPFSAPADLDAELERLGWGAIEDTRVMVRATLAGIRPEVSDPTAAAPAGLRWMTLGGDEYAQAVGSLRGSTALECSAHAERLRWSPTLYRGYAWCDETTGAVVACGQVAREGRLVGLYDVFTAPASRGRGLAASLCERMLSISHKEGADSAYLQVGADNHAARSVYRRLGFADGYAYHYRLPADAP